MQVSVLVDDIFHRAEMCGVSKARLAEKAGVRPETLSRLRFRENADFKTIANLAMAVGLRIMLSPLENAGVEVFSPSENALLKEKARQWSEHMLSTGLASREELHRRSGFFSLPNAKFEIKGLKGQPA